MPVACAQGVGVSHINREYKHVFIHNPKAAGTSMEKLHFVGGAGHATARNLCPIAPEFFSWGFARHPCDRLIATYAAAWQHGKRKAKGWGIPENF